MNVRGDRLYLGDRATGYLTYDITNEFNPVVIAHPPEPAAVSAFFQSGRVLYIGSPDGVISTYDMIDPDQPQLISSLVLSDEPVAIEKVGEHLFVLTRNAFHTLSVGLPLVAGDFDADGLAGAPDLVALVDFLFKRGAPPWRPNAADVNADGLNNLQDVVLLVDFLYGNGTALMIGAIE
jgi:hypothetical protein